MSRIPFAVDSNAKPNNPLHLQKQLDNFGEYWNNHKIRAEHEKPNMSGLTPRHTFTVPDLPAQQCGIAVDRVVIDALRNQVLVSREELMRWVDEEFEVTAQSGYEIIGEPSLDNFLCGWEIFESMESTFNVA